MDEMHLNHLSEASFDDTDILIKGSVNDYHREILGLKLVASLLRTSCNFHRGSAQHTLKIITAACRLSPFRLNARITLKF